MADKTRISGNLVSDNNIFVNVATDNTGIGTTNPTSKLHVVGDVNISGVTTTRALSVLNDLSIGGNLTVSGDQIIANVVELRVEDKNVVLGFTTAISPNNDTANGGGISVASTIGSSLVSLSIAGINTLPDTYKQLSWFKSGTFGVGTTDAWLSNQAIGIGTTQVLTGTALNVSGGNIIFNNNVGIGTTNPQATLDVSGNARFTGVITATSGNFSGILTTTNLIISGVSTLGITSTTNLTSQNLNISGITTVGFITASSIIVSGVSTFLNGPVLIGSVVSTGTTSQTLQVTGGAYVSGNLGIGTTNPQYKVDINGNTRVVGFLTGTDAYFSGIVTTGTINSTTGIITSLVGTSATITHLNATSGIVTNLNVTGVTTLGTVQVSSGTIAATVGIVTYYGDGQYLQNIVTGIGISQRSDDIIQYITYSPSIGNTSVLGVNTTSLTFNSLSGNLGIGTTNPTSKLYVVGDGYYSGILTASSFVGSGSSLTGLIPNTIANIDNNKIYYPLLSDVTAGSISSIFVSSTSIVFNPGTDSLGIGTTNPTQKLEVNGNILASGTVTANSDEKLKTNIVVIENALDKVLSLRGVEYDRIDSQEHQIGLIAQEVEKIIPEVIYPKPPHLDNDTKSIAYGNLVALLIEAIKEQNQRIEELERKLGEL